MKPRLQKADTAKIFDAFDRQRSVGQSELPEYRNGKVTLKREVMDRHDCAGARAFGKMEIGGREGGLPIVGVDDLGFESTDRTETDVRPDPRERRKSAGVVGPVATVGAQVRIARTVIEMRRVDCENVETLGTAGQQSRRASEQVGVFAHRRDAAELCHDYWIGGDERPNLDVFRSKRAR